MTASDRRPVRAKKPLQDGGHPHMTVGDRLLILCHSPFRTWNKMGRKSIDLHGHSHGKLKPVPRQFDVGVDAQDLRPVTLETILGGRRRPAIETAG